MRRHTGATPPNGVRAAPADSASGGTDGSRASGGSNETDRSGPNDSAPTTLADATTADGEAVLAALVEGGAVETSGDDATLAAGFGERWQAEIDRLRSRPPADLAVATCSVAPTAASARAVTEGERTFVVLSDGSGEPAGEVWLRQPVAVAETAAALALAATTDLDADRRAVAAHGLVVFLDECPVCETPLEEAKAGGCCGPPRTDADGHPLRALVCRDCRTQFAAFE